jgi:glycopeptide antibiotics resistance protein
MKWTRSRIALTVILGAIYLQRCYQYLLASSLPPNFNNERPFNLVPFRTIWGYLTDVVTPLDNRIYELAGNFLLFAPIALLLALSLRRFKVWPILALSLGLSIAVETLQYTLYTYRVADIDDVICNTSGAVFSYVLIALVLHVAWPTRFPTLRQRRSTNGVQVEISSSASREIFAADPKP